MIRDVAVVGAGIVGAACADALSRKGLSVAIYDGSTPGGGATAAGMGHIVAMDDSEAQFTLTRYSQGLWDRLVPELPAQIEFERRGTLWVAADEEEMGAGIAKQQWYAARGVSTEWLDAAALPDAEPNLRAGLAGGLLVRGDSVIYAPCAARWLLDRAIARGAEFHSSTVATVAALREKAVVVACGTASGQLVPDIAVRPRKGHLAITDRYPDFVRHQLVELGYLKSAHGHDAESVAFNVQPRWTGQVLVGSSRQYDTETPEVEHRMLARMLGRAVEYMPRLAALSVIRTWTGFRAATPDSLPLIGPHPEIERVWLATGHEGLGITTSLATGELIAASILGHAAGIPIEPYLPARFAHG
ncbi:MAG: FAD-dependent oxidoreductase [Bryobacteraceae bacterium]